MASSGRSSLYMSEMVCISRVAVGDGGGDKPGSSRCAVTARADVSEDFNAGRLHIAHSDSATPRYHI